MDTNHPLSTRSPASGAPSKNKWLSIFGLRLIGYALLLLTLVDTLALLIPPKLFDPNWELETIGRLVGQAPVQLIGFALVICGGPRFRKFLDRSFFQAVPILAIVLGVCFCLMMPLGIADSRRVGSDYQQETATFTKQITELRKVEQRLSNAPAADAVSWVQKYLPQMNTGQEPEAIKIRVLAQIRSEKTGVQAQMNRVAQQSTRLLKNTIKSVVGAVISGLSFMYIGRTVRKFPKANAR